MNLTPSTFVQIEGTSVRYTVNNLAEAKIAMKELKIKKKEFGLLKREIAGRQNEIRAGYTHEVRNRGSMMRAGGGFGKIVRMFQTASRDSKRAGLAHDLAPLETEKNEIEALINAIDSLMIRLEVDMLKFHN